MEQTPLSPRVIWLHSPTVLMAALLLGGLFGYLTPALNSQTAHPKAEQPSAQLVSAARSHVVTKGFVPWCFSHNASEQLIQVQLSGSV